MAIDFPTPTQVGELFTDSSTGVTYECEQLGPPVVWVCYAGASPTPDAFVTIDTTQTITGVKTFSGDPTTFEGDIATPSVTVYSSGGVEPTLATITAGSFDLQNGVSWTCGAIAVPNPTNTQPGMTGQILLTAAPSGWGASFKFPSVDGAAGTNTQPETATYPAIVPYFVQAADSILLGTPIPF